jgi:hypothetical protein
MATLVLALAAALPSSAWDAGLMHAAAQRLGPRAGRGFPMNPGRHRQHGEPHR